LAVRLAINTAGRKAKKASKVLPENGNYFWKCTENLAHGKIAMQLVAAFFLGCLPKTRAQKTSSKKPLQAVRKTYKKENYFFRPKRLFLVKYFLKYSGDFACGGKNATFCLRRAWSRNRHRRK